MKCYIRSLDAMSCLPAWVVTRRFKSFIAPVRQNAITLFARQTTSLELPCFCSGSLASARTVSVCANFINFVLLGFFEFHFHLFDITSLNRFECTHSNTVGLARNRSQSAAVQRAVCIMSPSFPTYSSGHHLGSSMTL